MRAISSVISDRCQMMMILDLFSTSQHLKVLMVRSCNDVSILSSSNNSTTTNKIIITIIIIIQICVTFAAVSHR